LTNGQFYRVSTDYDFPYHVCGPQQDSGRRVSRAAATSARSDRTTGPGRRFREWILIADPLDKRYIHAGWYHVLRRYDRTTGQVVVLY
jgi:hypothetical protein